MIEHFNIENHVAFAYHAETSYQFALFHNFKLQNTIKSMGAGW